MRDSAAALLLLLLVPLQVALAQPMMLVESPLLEHPAGLPAHQRTGTSWRQMSGAWGESFSEQTLRLRGFQEVLEVKNASNNGFDRIAIKYAPDGSVMDIRVVEVKTHRGGKPRLGETRSGRQMSRKWMADRLRAMNQSRDPRLRQLARAIRQFSKTTGRPLTDLGEVHSINTRTGRFTIFGADGRTERASFQIHRLLRQIANRAYGSQVRIWASRSLAQLKSIRAQSMSTWLADSTAITKRAAARPATVVLRAAAVTRPGQIILRRALIRTAGPLAIVIATGVDAKEIYDIERAYRRGMITRRDRNIRVISTGGGILGAGLGAWGGAKIGMGLGALGGPLAPYTVPLGGVVGGVVGGVAGYMGGSALGSFSATAWHDRVDERVRKQAEEILLAAPR